VCMSFQPDYVNRPTESLICYFGSLAKKYGGINLAQGIPGFQPPKELLDILSSLVYEDYHQYAPGHGNQKLLTLLAKHYQQYLPVSEENILIVQGATEAGSLLFTYLRSIIDGKFSALALDPVYETFSHLPAIYNANFVPFYTNNNTIDFSLLEETIIENRVKVIFLNSPGNPLGSLLSKEDYLQFIALSKKHEFYIILDAVYKELYFESEPYLPLDSIGERMFYVNSFSKMLSVTGWRVGYFITSTSHMQKINQIHDYTGLCAPALFQEAIAQYLINYDFGKDYLNSIRHKLHANYTLLSQYLISKGFKISDIKGGYFIWAELPKRYIDGYDFSLKLYEYQQVAIVPGEHFTDHGNRYVRFNIARKEHEIKEAIDRLEIFLNQNI